MGRLTSENRPQRGQFLPDLQAHSPAMGQENGEEWTAAVDLQPTIPKSDRLLYAPDHLVAGLLVSPQHVYKRHGALTQTQAIAGNRVRFLVV